MPRRSTGPRLAGYGLAASLLGLLMLFGCGGGGSDVPPIWVPGGGVGGGAGAGGGAADRGPVALDDTASTAAGTPVVIALLANDVDPDGDPLTISKVTQGGVGTVVIDPGAATVTYTPPAGWAGSDSFSYTAVDPTGGHSSALCTVNVAGGGGGGGGGGLPPGLPIVRVSSNAIAAAADPDISGDGRHVVFGSWDTDLLPGDTNFGTDIFLLDRLTGSYELMSRSTSLGFPNGLSQYPVITPDGRLVAFHSQATDLVAVDTNGRTDSFALDRTSGVMTNASVDSGGVQAVFDVNFPALSADGRYVVFESVATNLVPLDTNGVADVFRHDLVTGATVRVSVDGAGGERFLGSSQAVASSDGRYVAFRTRAAFVAGDTNGVDDIYRKDMVTGALVLASVSSVGATLPTGSSWGRISGDGNLVTFVNVDPNVVPGDTNGQGDLFLRDIAGGTTTRVSLTSLGGELDGTTWDVDLSNDGRWVVATSNATNIVPGDTGPLVDVFVWDRVSGQVARVNVSAGGAEANNSSFTGRISDDGRYVAFVSAADNLVPGDTNFQDDVFVAPNPLAP